MCTDIESTPECSRLLKLTKGAKKHEVGLMKKADGTFTKSPEESMELLMETKFPGSEPSQSEAEKVQDRHERAVKQGFKYNKDRAFLDPKRVKTVYDSFENGKKEGPDGCTPQMAKSLPPNYIANISKLYNAMISFGYTPANLKDANVVFLPKPGKSDYALPGAFRPISLTSFIFKGLEKLATWQIRDTIFRQKPTEGNQHAFRPGFSTESAISRVVYKASRGIKKKKYTLAVFLDVKGAFDNLDSHAAIKAMKRRGLDPELIAWYGDYLTDRTCFS
jgi:hypothetical protein